MTNNFDEFDHHDGELAEEGGAPAGGIRGNLAEAWRSKPLFKLMVLMVGVAAVVAVSVNLFSGNKTEERSRLVTPPKMHEAPGGVVSPYMKQQTDLADKSRAEDALNNGGSALPTPTGQTADTEGAKKDEALNELKSETEHLKQQLLEVQKQQNQQVVQPRPLAPPVAAKPEPFDDSLAQAMQIQMQHLADSWSPHGIHVVDGRASSPVVAGATPVAGAVAAIPGTTTTNADGSVVDSAGVALKTKALVSAGTVNYAQLLTEANSDVPGPILAQIMSGPLTGARAVGAFQVKNEYLVLQFTTANLKGVDYNISAVALDPDTTLGGMATEVDERYFTRVVLPAAASFMQGLGSALGQNNSSITTTGTTTIATQTSDGAKQGMYQGLGQAANTAGQFFQNQANLTKVLVRVAAGTPIGLFFTRSVLDNAAQDKADAEREAILRANVNSQNGYTPAGTYPVNPYTPAVGAYPAAAAGSATGGGSSDVPYPNIGQSSNRGYGAGVPGMGGSGYYGH